MEDTTLSQPAVDFILLYLAEEMAKSSLINALTSQNIAEQPTMPGTTADQYKSVNPSHGPVVIDAVSR